MIIISFQSAPLFRCHRTSTHFLPSSNPFIPFLSFLNQRLLASPHFNPPIFTSRFSSMDFLWTPTLVWKFPAFVFLLVSAILIWHFDFSFSSFSHLYMYLPHSHYHFVTSFSTRVKKKTYHVSCSCCYLFCIQLNISRDFFYLFSFNSVNPFHSFSQDVEKNKLTSNSFSLFHAQYFFRLLFWLLILENFSFIYFFSYLFNIFSH